MYNGGQPSALWVRPLVKAALREPHGFAHPTPVDGPIFHGWKHMMALATWSSSPPQLTERG